MSTLVYLGVFGSFRDNGVELPHLQASKGIDRRVKPGGLDFGHLLDIQRA